MKRLKFKNLICFENDNFIAINKPAGVASLHEHIGLAQSIIEIAKEHDENIQLCHRLDKDTTGVLLLSKHADAYRHASMAFERRKVTKKYHAVAEGIHDFKELTVSLPLITTRSGRASIDHRKGKTSTTTFNTLEQFEHYTLVECQPLTGRLHQIRIHLAGQNAAIAADTIYGGKEPMLSKLKRNFSLGKYEEEKPMIERFALHARSLEFEGMDGKTILCTAEYPKDFAVFLKLLKKYDQKKF